MWEKEIEKPKGQFSLQYSFRSVLLLHWTCLISHLSKHFTYHWKEYFLQGSNVRLSSTTYGVFLHFVYCLPIKYHSTFKKYPFCTKKLNLLKKTAAIIMKLFIFLLWEKKSSFTICSFGRKTRDVFILRLQYTKGFLMQMPLKRKNIKRIQLCFLISILLFIAFVSCQVMHMLHECLQVILSECSNIPFVCCLAKGTLR